MQRIVLIGAGGAGKSTLALRLGNITGIQVYHLDRLFWQPGWVSIPKEELKDKIKKITVNDTWIIDGNYKNTMEMRMEAADTIIYLDFPSIICLWGIFKRRYMYARGSRPDMTEGCEEKIDFEFFSWVLKFRRNNRKRILALLTKYKEGRNIFIFKNRRQIKSFISKLELERK